ncbi:MAG TPA: hypothetical protein PKE40_03725 [Arachnia sp.]|nr:hypothetical protein [Arachnia sp.]HMT85440.1 hypothetical protein [Arachnia sp.]
MSGREVNGSWDPFASSVADEPKGGPPIAHRAKGGVLFLCVVILTSIALGITVYAMLGSVRISQEAVKYATGFGALMGLCMTLCVVVLVVAMYRGLRHRRPIDVAALIFALLLPPAIFVTGMSAGASVLVDNLGEDIAMLADASNWLLALVGTIKEAFE